MDAGAGIRALCLLSRCRSPQPALPRRNAQEPPFQNHRNSLQNGRSMVAGTSQLLWTQTHKRWPQDGLRPCLNLVKRAAPSSDVKQ